MSSLRVGFIGAGNMAEAIARGLLSSGAVTPENIIASDVTNTRRDLFKNELHTHTTRDNNHVVHQSDFIFLAVKPQCATGVLKELTSFPSDKVLISILAGKTTEWLENQLKHVSSSVRIVRVMPNTPTLVGSGTAAVSRGSKATDEDVNRVREMLSTCNPYITEVEEQQLHAVTSVSGSGPAYVFYMLEGLVEGGKQEGLDEEEALSLALQMVKGAAELVMQSRQSPQELRRNVTSAGGTTQAALNHLENNNWKQVLVEAMHQCAERSKEMARE